MTDLETTVNDIVIDWGQGRRDEAFAKIEMHPKSIYLATRLMREVIFNSLSRPNPINDADATSDSLLSYLSRK